MKRDTVVRRDVTMRVVNTCGVSEVPLSELLSNVMALRELLMHARFDMEVIMVLSYVMLSRAMRVEEGGRRAECAPKARTISILEKQTPIFHEPKDSFLHSGRA